jgi:hypothetical protein
MSCHRLDDLVRDWWNTQVAYGDGIEGLEVVDKSKGAILLFDAKPAGAVRGIGVLVHTSGDLLLE